MKTKILAICGFLLLFVAVFVPQALAADLTDVTSNKGLTAIGMGLAVGLSALGTGVAQARIGAAGLGSAVEKPETLGLALIFLLLPETLVIFGLVIAFILLGRL
ncbi:MAG: F0F1 ATP synthase subunit C [Desulfobaccales bacterium]